MAEDGRSYRPENFTEAADIAGKVELPGFDPSLVPTLEALAAGVIQASEDVQADDEVCPSSLTLLLIPIVIVGYTLLLAEFLVLDIVEADVLSHACTCLKQLSCPLFPLRHHARQYMNKLRCAVDNGGSR